MVHRVSTEDILSGIETVVHEEKVDFADIVDKERLVAGGHEVSCLLVRAIADLRRQMR